MAAVEGPVDLVSQISWAAVECLNEDEAKPAANALKEGLRDQDALQLQSDADEQLLLTVPFSQVVRLHSIRIKGPADGTGPKTVKFFVNQPSMGFEDAESHTPAQTLTLDAAALAGEKLIPLHFVKFQRVSQVSVFFADNQGGTDDVTCVSRIDLAGMTVETTNMKDFKKVG